MLRSKRSCGHTGASSGQLTARISGKTAGAPRALPPHTRHPADHGRIGSDRAG